jgi:hypothetical protein
MRDLPRLRDAEAISRDNRDHRKQLETNRRPRPLYHKPSVAHQKNPQKIESRTLTTPTGFYTPAAHTPVPASKPAFQRHLAEIQCDGKHLFKAFLRTLDLDANHHAELRQRCVGHTLDQWNRYEKYCNLIYSDPLDFARLTTRASDYAAYMHAPVWKLGLGFRSSGRC